MKYKVLRKFYSNTHGMLYERGQTIDIDLPDAIEKSAILNGILQPIKKAK